MPKEIELKIALPPHCIKHFEEISWHPEHCRIVSSTTHKLYSIYYDTPDLRLMNLGCSLRLRRAGETWVQTVKAGGSIVAGLHQHDEWEAPIPTAQLNFALFKNPKLKALFKDPNLREALQPIFNTKFTRHLRYLKLGHESEVELCLDHGSITADSKRATICEIELELKAGDPLEVLQFAYMLVDKSPYPLRLENASKAERGYILYSGQMPSPVKAIKTEIANDTKLNIALKMIMENCLDQLSKNENGMRTIGADIEYLHQMRVALRRLRSAINIFHQAFPDAEIKPIRKDLKWLTKQLNPARDWDIFVTETLPLIAKHFPQHIGFSRVLDTCKTIRRKHNETARLSVNSRRYTKLMLSLSIWLTKISQQEPENTDIEKHRKPQLPDTRTFISTALTALHHEILETGKNLDKLDTTALHALRIHIKKQRYISEFFQTLFQSSACAQYIFLLARLQDMLGSINDYACTQRFLDEIYINKDKNRQHEAIGVIHGWTTRSFLEKKAELNHAWNAFNKAKPYWEDSASNQD